MYIERFLKSLNVDFWKTSKVTRLFPFLAAIVVFSLVVFSLSRMLPGVQSVEIDIQTDHRDQLHVYYSQADKFYEEAVSEPVPIGEQRAKVKVVLSGSFASFLRIDTGEQIGTAKIFQIKVMSYFHQPLLLGPSEIGQRFVAGPHASMRVYSDFVQVTANEKDPYLVGITRLFPPMYWQSCLVALVFAAMVVIIMMRRTQPVGSDDLSKSSLPFTSPERFDALDGLRGIAAMMVVADHTCGWFRGLGASGVWIFFATSGFLLARPFVVNSQAILSFAYMSTYLRRRCMRILPMYYTYIFVVYVVSGRINMAIMHGLFLEGAGHLWAIPQEILFYFLWPWVVFVLVLPLRKYKKTTLVALLLAILFWNHYVGQDRIWLIGMDFVKLQLYFGVFLSGVFFSFLYSYSFRSTTVVSRLQRIGHGIASPLGLGIIIFFLLFSTGNIIGQKVIYSQKYFGVFGFLAGFLLFITLCAKGKILDRFLCLAPFRELGRVGLSLYLVHPLVKNLIDDVCISFLGNKAKNSVLFFLTLVLSYILAKYTFTHIERPGFFEKSPK